MATIHTYFLFVCHFIYGACEVRGDSLEGPLYGLNIRAPGRKLHITNLGLEGPNFSLSAPPQFHITRVVS